MKKSFLNSKKGAVAVWLMVLGVMTIASYILIVAGSDKHSLEFIGSTQQKVMNAQENTLQLKEFLDMSIELAVFMTFNEISSSSLYLEQLDEGCSAVVYPLLNSKEREKIDCFPNYEEAFKFLFRKNFDLLLTQFKDFYVDSAYFVIELSKDTEGLVLRVQTREAISVPIYHDLNYFKDSRLSEALSHGIPKYSNDGTLLVPIKGIPNILCEEIPSSYGKICAANVELLNQLRKISEEVLVRKDLTMVITQAYRTYAIQKKLYDDICVKDNECWKVCNPDGRFPCSHMIAGAIDLEIYENYGTDRQKVLNKLNPHSSEQDRQKVYDIMCSYDFVRYGREPWHFEYGTNQWEISQKHLKDTNKKRCTY